MCHINKIMNKEIINTHEKLRGSENSALIVSDYITNLAISRLQAKRNKKSILRSLAYKLKLIDNDKYYKVTLSVKDVNSLLRWMPGLDESIFHDLKYTLPYLTRKTKLVSTYSSGNKIIGKTIFIIESYTYRRARITIQFNKDIDFYLN